AARDERDCGAAPPRSAGRSGRLMPTPTVRLTPPPAGQPARPAAARRTSLRTLPAPAARPARFAEALAAAQPAAVRSPAAPPKAVDFAPLINQAAHRYGLDPALLAGLIQTESGFNPR